jgi:hypothetical protein
MQIFKNVCTFNVHCQHITIQKNVVITNDFNYLRGAVACPLSGPADGGKPKRAALTPGIITFKVVLNSKLPQILIFHAELKKLN